MQLPQPTIHVSRVDDDTPLTIAKQYALRLVASYYWQQQRYMAGTMCNALHARLRDATPEHRALVYRRVIALAAKLQGVLDRFALDTTSVNARRRPRKGRVRP